VVGTYATERSSVILRLPFTVACAFLCSPRIPASPLRADWFRARLRVPRARTTCHCPHTAAYITAAAARRCCAHCCATRSVLYRQHAKRQRDRAFVCDVTFDIHNAFFAAQKTFPATPAHHTCTHACAAARLQRIFCSPRLGSAGRGVGTLLLMLVVPSPHIHLILRLSHCMLPFYWFNWLV